VNLFTSAVSFTKQTGSFLLSDCGDQLLQCIVFGPDCVRGFIQGRPWGLITTIAESQEIMRATDRWAFI
jgi:hypothetical protein